MVYVPLTRARARQLRDAGSLNGPIPAHGVTPALLRSHDLRPEDEDAEYTALAYAGVSALALDADPLRLIIAAEPAPDDAETGASTAGPDADPFGRIVLPRLSWAAVTALFADDAVSAERLADARRLAAGRSFDELVDDEQLGNLLDDSDLLWFAREELDRLP